MSQMWKLPFNHPHRDFLQMRKTPPFPPCLRSTPNWEWSHG